MVKVVGVRFKKAGKIYYFDPIDIDINKNNNIIVETARGIEFGEVVVGPKEVLEKDIITPLKPVIRIATEEDEYQHNENKRKEKEALEVCTEKIQEHKLDMKLVDVEYTFDNNKVIFYFTADGRVDFRELVKDLAAIFKTRIELRQIGVRDEAKMLGGIGPCGRSLCCSTWLGDFEPVSIKMAKDQNLSLNPSKISGICGRLFCCLKYEHDVYAEILAKLPSKGTKVITADGEGVVIDTNIILECVKVRLNKVGKNDSEIKVYLLQDVTKKSKVEQIKREEKLEQEENKELKKDMELEKDMESEKDVELEENIELEKDVEEDIEIEDNNLEPKKDIQSGEEDI